MKYKIEHSQDECIGCGACAAASPDYFEMNSIGKSDLKNHEKQDNKQILKLKKDYEENLEAADYCPVNCIHIFKTENNKEKKVI